MSRAVLRWLALGRPEALRNVVCAMPSSRARWVISRAKPLSLPAMPSARTTAMSLADRVTSE